MHQLYSHASVDVQIALGRKIVKKWWLCSLIHLETSVNYHLLDFVIVVLIIHMLVECWHINILQQIANIQSQHICETTLLDNSWKQIFIPNKKRGTNLETKHLELKHMSRPKFFTLAYRRLTQPNLEKGIFKCVWLPPREGRNHKHTTGNMWIEMSPFRFSCKKWSFSHYIIIIIKDFIAGWLPSHRESQVNKDIIDVK